MTERTVGESFTHDRPNPHGHKPSKRDFSDQELRKALEPDLRPAGSGHPYSGFIDRIGQIRDILSGMARRPSQPSEEGERPEETTLWRMGEEGADVRLGDQADLSAETINPRVPKL